jgi:hypothetical protein
MARADQDRQYLERWLEDAEPRNDGSLYLVLQLARGALASRNANRIYDALITCLAADRHAVELAVRNVQARRRRAGGRQTGAKQTECATTRWAPHRARYRELVDAGKSPATALAVVRDQMGPSAPSDKTLRKQLRKKSEPS